MKMRFITAAILLLISTKSEAFTFDVWKSGMDADTVIMTAMKEDLPIAVEGKFAAGHFDKKACLPYRKTATKYIYHTELLGKRATVYLLLTERDKRLMQITVSWSNAKDLEKVIEKIILNKKPVSKRKKADLFSHTIEYKIDDENKIALQNQMDNMYLTYYDLPLIDSNTVQKKEKKQNKLIKDVSKDWKKF